MSAPNLQTTALMTEHLGYPPISLLDDIINCVNDILYKCTNAMEKYLLKKSEVNGEDYSHEIRVGIAQLETLLENSLDRNFDRLELYVLRNVLRIPEELIVSNVFRLKHQKNMVLAKKTLRKISESSMRSKMEEIEHELDRNKQLKELLSRVKHLKVKVENYKNFVKRICIIETPELRPVYESLRPIDNSIVLLTKQLKQLYESSEEICSTDAVNAIRRERREKERQRQQELDNNTIKFEIREPNLNLLNSIP
ncbi:kinetochore-associated protein Mtw1p [Monosporozyma unispora]|nr:hypothetical protein C6P44_002811 [Kazachstania unispora]